MDHPKIKTGSILNLNCARESVFQYIKQINGTSRQYTDIVWFAIVYLMSAYSNILMHWAPADTYRATYLMTVTVSLAISLYA